MQTQSERSRRGIGDKDAAWEPIPRTATEPSEPQLIDSGLFPHAASPTSLYSGGPDALYQTASRESPVPMSHPTPDLQAIQGAYVSNVERLEQHAERLSFSSDLTEELRRLKGGPKRQDSNMSPLLRSPTSAREDASNSVSKPNPPRSDSMNTNQQDGITISKSPDASYGSPFQLPGNLIGASDLYSTSSGVVAEGEAGTEGRSTVNGLDQLYNAARAEVWETPDVEKKAREMPVGFDGTYVNDRQQPTDDNGVDSTMTHRASSTKLEPMESAPTGLIYYPAPIPAMLSLPPKLSKRRSATTAEFSSPGELNRAHPTALGNDDSIQNIPHDDTHANKTFVRVSRLSAPYPDAKNLSQKERPVPALQRLNDSAVKTLDRLLDASVHAPVGAFTDHPIAGSSGADIYRSSRPPQKGTDSGINKTGTTDKGVDNLALSTSESIRDISTSGYPGISASSTPPSQDGRTTNAMETTQHNSRPTTLLAELESRKSWQHSRNKSAADAFPDGMHATLLQLDQVAQRQRDVRKTKPTTLVWEATARTEEADLDDEDVPLALLPRVQTNHVASDPLQTLSLLDVRQLDDNEPLSARRARLTGVGGPEGRAVGNNIAGKNPSPSQGNGIEDRDSDDNRETLTQRKRRLHIENALPADKGLSGELTSEILGELRIPLTQTTPATDRVFGGPPPSEDDETLAQRRLRLRKVGP